MQNIAKKTPLKISVVNDTLTSKVYRDSFITRETGKWHLSMTVLSVRLLLLKNEKLYFAAF